MVALTSTLSTDVVDSGPATTLEQAMFARSAMSAPVASKIRKPSSPSIAISAKSHGLDDSRAAVSRASNCRWVKPRVGDSAGTDGQRTCWAGECSSRPSMTQVL